MKRAMTLTLLLALIFNFLGAGFVYNIWLYSIKHTVKENLDQEYSDQSRIIKVPKAWSNNPPKDFKWHEDDEFEYRGQMYDIIREEAHGNKIWYYCYWDKAETKLLKHLSKYVSNYLQQHPDKQHQASTLQSYLNKTFLLSKTNGLLEPDRKTLFLRIINPEIESISLGIKTPPPQLAMSSPKIR